ncbi:MAG: hypothetical protein EAZ06_00775 [Cytophagales bacterium]|nr:MAG: hypothetical protein EAZ06_00775 [Cytophagales bacterium]
MIYPLIEDYKDSFRNPENYFDTLKPLYPVNAPWDNKQPYFASGGFATVFKLKDKNQKYWAFKCFTQEVKDRKERLQVIATHLQQLKSPYFVDFKYMEKELWVCSEKAGDKEQPIVVMEWIEGKILGKFIEEKVKENDRNALFQTLQKFVQMSEYLLQNGIAHGDLKHDNIFVKQNGDLVLIDYDGMFVPALWDKPMIEAGSPSYQHPQRPQAPFNNQLDHFSMLVIVIDLYALYLNPALRNALKDSDSLLIQQNDLQNPAQSPLFAQLNQLKDTFLNQMLLELKRSLANQQIYVVGLGNIIKEVRRIEYQDKIIVIPTNSLTLEWWHNLDEEWQKIYYAHVKLWKEKGILLTEDFIKEKKEKKEFDSNDAIYTICTIMNVNIEQIRVDNYFLDNLLALPVLYCYNLNIEDISPLRDLKNLTSLNLYDNEISDISILKDLKNLTSLDLKSNKISDITALKELKNLTSLELRFNEIRDITALKELENLTSLSLRHNQITDNQRQMLKNALPNCKIEW